MDHEFVNGENCRTALQPQAAPVIERASEFETAPFEPGVRRLKTVDS